MKMFGGMEMKEEERIWLRMRGYVRVWMSEDRER